MTVCSDTFCVWVHTHVELIYITLLPVAAPLLIFFKFAVCWAESADDLDVVLSVYRHSWSNFSTVGAMLKACLPSDQMGFGN